MELSNKLFGIIVFICVSFFSNAANGQSKELLDRISIRNKVNLYLYEKKYDSIILLSKKIHFRDTPYLYGIESSLAKAFIEKGDTTNAIKFLRKAIEMQNFNSPENLKYSFNEYFLSNNVEYIKLLENYYSLSNVHATKINIDIYNVCSEIQHTDTRIRLIWMTTTDSSLKKSIERTMWLSDSMNIDLMKSIFRKYKRYPGISDIGITLTNDLNYIVGHWAEYLNQDTLYQYLITATLNGQIPNWFGPRLLDKLEFKKGKPLIYGEFGTATDYVDDTFIYPEIVDIENVDKRRAEFLLQPLYKKALIEKSKLPKGYNIIQKKK